MIKNLIKSIKKSQKSESNSNSFHRSSDHINLNVCPKPDRVTRKPKIKLQYTNPSLNIEELTISIVNTNTGAKERRTPLLKWSASLDNLVKGCPEDRQNEKEFSSDKRNSNSFEGDNSYSTKSKMISEYNSGINMADELKVELSMSTPSSSNTKYCTKDDSSTVHKKCFEEDKENKKVEIVDTAVLTPGRVKNYATLRKALFVGQTPVPLPRKSKYHSSALSCNSLKFKPAVFDNQNVITSSDVHTCSYFKDSQKKDYIKHLKFDDDFSKNTENHELSLKNSKIANSINTVYAMKSINEENVLENKQINLTNENYSLTESPHFILSTSNLNDSSCTYISYFKESDVYKTADQGQLSKLQDFKKLYKLNENTFEDDSLGNKTFESESVFENSIKYEENRKSMNDFNNLIDNSKADNHECEISEGQTINNLKLEIEKKLHVIDNLKNVNEELEEKINKLREETKCNKATKSNFFELLTSCKDVSNKTSWKFCPLSLCKDNKLQFMIKTDQFSIPFIKRINSNEYLMESDKIIEMNGTQTINMSEMEMMSLYNSLPDNVPLNIVVLRKEINSFENDKWDKYSMDMEEMGLRGLKKIHFIPDELKSKEDFKIEMLEIFKLLDSLQDRMFKINQVKKAGTNCSNGCNDLVRCGQNNQLEMIIIDKLKSIINNF